MDIEKLKEILKNTNVQKICDHDCNNCPFDAVVFETGYNVYIVCDMLNNIHKALNEQDIT